MFQPHKLGPGSLQLGETGSAIEFSAQLRECAVEPSVKSDDPIAVLSGDEYDGDTTESFKLSGKALQTYDLDGLTVFCHVNRNTRTPFTFRPDNNRALGVRGTVIVRDTAVGGKVKEYNDADFEFDGVDYYELLDMTGPTPTVVTTFSPTAADSPNDGTSWN